MPGLWDSHVHLTKAGANSLALFIANGVTSVRDMGSDPAEVSQWRTEIAAGKRVGPRIRMAGPILESAANVARRTREGTVERVHRIRLPVANPEEARAAVERIAKPGADHIKMRTTPERVWVCTTLVNIEGSILVPHERAKKLLADVEGRLDPRRRYVGGYLLSDWREQVNENRERPLDRIRKMLPGWLRDFRDMRAAAVNPAGFYGIDNTLGAIGSGHRADLVLLDNNPLDDITHTLGIRGVMAAGGWFDRAALARLLSEAVPAQ
jgi:hypothetical protein